MFYFACIVSIIILLFTLLLKWYQRNYFGDALKIPGPPSVFLLGNASDLGFTMEEIFANLIRLRKKYGSFFGLWISSFQFKVVVTEPKHIEQILTSTVHLNKGASYDVFDPVLGNSLIKSEATRWKKDRKILNQTFHVSLLQEFAETFNSVSNKFIEILKAKGLNGPIDITHYAQSCTLDAICEAMLGVKIDAENDVKEFAKGLEDHLELLMIKFLSLIGKIDFYYRFTKACKEEKKTLKIVRDFVRSIVRNRERKRNSCENNNDQDYNGRKKVAFLDLLLDFKEDGFYTEDDVIDQVTTFIIAGHHTVSSALSFLLYEVSKHPEIQEKVLQEVHSVVGTDNNDTITLQDVQKLQYTECVIKETLRKYPPVPIFERTLSEDMTMGDFRLAKGTQLLFFTYGLHHDEKLFPNPETFDPDRFSSGRIDEIEPYSFTPFSHGPRNCIGMPYAMCLLKVCVPNIIRKLQFMPMEDEHKVVLFADVALKSVNGLPVNIKAR